MPSPTPEGQGQPSLTLHRYGVGVDCHSRFFQVCVLIPHGTNIVKLERKVRAVWPELRAAKEWLLRTLEDHDIAISPLDLRYTCESTGQYHMPLCLAWRGRPAIINPSDTGHVRRKTDRLDAGKLAQHSLHGLWRKSWIAPGEIQEQTLGLEIAGFQWTGEISPQKWMNFYTKVLSRFATAGGLKLTVTVDVAPPGGTTVARLEETRVALRELGLPEYLSAKGRGS